MKRLEDCKRIGILGGTFNPIHVGHLFMAEYAREAMNLDKILFIPTGVPYMKNAIEILPGDVRMKMVNLSIQENEHFASSDIELQREGNTYTYETLESIHEMYPDAELFFIVGADCLFSIANWYMPQRIFDNCILLATNRNDASLNELYEKKKFLEETFQAKVVLIDFPSVDISSTMIRENISVGKSIRYMVHDAVYEYIQENKLYQEN